MMRKWFRLLPVFVVLAVLTATPAFPAPGRDASPSGNQAVPPLPPSPPTPPIPPAPPAAQAAPSDRRAAPALPAWPSETPAGSSRAQTMPEPPSPSGSQGGSPLPRQSGQVARSMGRYQLVTGVYQDKNNDAPVTILLDTASGRTWFLTAGLYWSPMPLEKEATGQRARLVRSGLVYTPE